MAVYPGYIRNANIGSYAPVVDLHTPDATAKYTIGQKYTDNLGRTFRYAHFAQDVTQAKLVSPEQNDADVEGWLEQTAAITTITGGTSAAKDTNTVAIGNKFIRLTLATVFDSVVKDQYTGCMLGIAAGTGVGYAYTIKSNSAVSSSMVRFELNEGLKVALAASAGTDIMISPSPVSNLVVTAPTADTSVVGVTLANMDVSVAAYGWICTRGPVLCLCEANTTVILGGPITQSQDDAGAWMIAAAGHTSVADLDEAPVGYAIHVGTDQEYGFIMFTGGLD